MKRSIRIGTLVAMALSAAAWAQDWPQWRGPNRDGHIVGFKAPATWPKELQQKWSKTVGEGVSSPVLAAGKIYVFSRIGPDEVTTCLNADTGEQLWQDKLKTQIITSSPAGPGNKFAGTRSTPAVGEGKVCTLGATTTVSCLDANTGDVAWRKEVKYVPKFFTSSSPVIVDGKCITYTDSLTAFDLATGEVRWRWKGNDAPYGSPVLMTVDGVKQVVTPSQGAVAGVALADGKLLWKFDFGGSAWQSTYATPIIDGQTVIYGAPGGKGAAGGLVAYKIEKNGDAFEAKELWKSPVSAYQYNTPVLHDGYLYGLSSAKKFFCVDAKTGKEVWQDSKVRGEAGGVLDAGSVILALTGQSELVAFEPTSKGYSEMALYKVSPTPGYSHPIVSGNRIYVKGERDLTLWTIE